MNQLLEDKRSQLLSRSKTAEKEKGDGKTRYEKRVKSKFSSSVKEYNQINMNQLFKDNILTVNIPVVGETDNYIVTISFGGLLDLIQERVQKNNNVIDLRIIIQCLIECFNKDNVYIHCSCADWKYRMAFWATKNDINSGEPQESNGKWIRNPEDQLGPGCKHVMLCLANTGWIIKVASVINNYIKYMSQHYQKMYQTIIYPAIYGKEYEGDIQLDIYDQDELDTSKETVDVANIEGGKSGRFKAGNKYRYQKQEKPDEEQITIDETENEEET